MLVVEDEPLLLEAIVKKLKLMGLSVTACSSGLDAWNNLENEQVVPKVVWLDFYLPDTNGLEFAKRLKGDDRWKNVPIVVVSNSASLDKVQQMRDLGITDFYVKADHRLEEIVQIMKQKISRV